MPESNADTQDKIARSINGHGLEAGAIWDLGCLNVSPEEIIEFAKMVDPLPFHIDPVAAEASHFGTLVASGPMMYSEYHKRKFIDFFGPSILAGRGITDWTFYQPHYPDTDYFGTVTALETSFRPEKGTVMVTWHFVFRDANDAPAQELKVRIMHKLDRAGQ